MQPHPVGRRVVQHDRHAIEVRDAPEDLRQLPDEAPQIAARGGRARDVEQDVMNVRRKAQTVAPVAVPGVHGRITGLLLRVHPEPIYRAVGGESTVSLTEQRLREALLRFLCRLFAAAVVAGAQVVGALVLVAPAGAEDVKAADVLGLALEDAGLVGGRWRGGELDGAGGERGGKEEGDETA